MATWMQGSAVRAIGTLPDGIRLCFENAEVDAVLNHMAGPFVFSPEKDRGKAGQGTKPSLWAKRAWRRRVAKVRTPKNPLQQSAGSQCQMQMLLRVVHASLCNRKSDLAYDVL